MAIATVYTTDAEDGRAYRAGTSRADLDAQTGGTTGTAVNPGAGMYRSSTSSYDVIQGFLSFDTSSLPTNAVITNVNLKLYTESLNVSASSSWTLRVHPYDHGLTVEATDMRTKAQVQAMTELGSSSIGNFSAATWTTVSIATGSINRVGATRLLLNSSLYEDGTTISANGGAYVYFAEGTNRVYLEITYEIARVGETWLTPAYDSYVECNSALSSTVEQGLGSLTLQDPSTPYLYSGVAYAGSLYRAYQSLVSFDTSSISTTPASVTLKFKAADDYGMPANKTFDVYTFDFGTAEAADFRNRAWVQAATSLGAFTILQGQTRSTIEEVTLSASSIVQGGSSKFVIVSQDFRDGLWPAASGTTYAMADLTSNEYSTAAGYPRLVITSDSGGAASRTAQTEATLYADGPTYADAQAATADAQLAASGNFHVIGQEFAGGTTYRNYALLLDFDTTHVNTSATVSNVQLTLVSFMAQTARTVEVYALDFGSTVELADYPTPIDLSGGTLLGSATSATTAGGSFSISLSSAGLNKSGSTRLAVVTSDYPDTITPVGDQTVYIASAAHASYAAPTLNWNWTSPAPPGSGNPVGPGTFRAIGSGTLQVRKNGQWVQL